MDKFPPKKPDFDQAMRIQMRKRPLILPGVKRQDVKTVNQKWNAFESGRRFQAGLEHDRYIRHTDMRNEGWTKKERWLVYSWLAIGSAFGLGIGRMLPEGQPWWDAGVIFVQISALGVAEWTRRRAHETYMEAVAKIAHDLGVDEPETTKGPPTLRE